MFHGDSANTPIVSARCSAMLSSPIKVGITKGSVIPHPTTQRAQGHKLVRRLLECIGCMMAAKGSRHRRSTYQLDVALTLASMWPPRASQVPNSASGLPANISCWGRTTGNASPTHTDRIRVQLGCCVSFYQNLLWVGYVSGANQVAPVL